MEITWPDALMMIANIIFIIVMIPTVHRSDSKPALLTSIGVTIGMILMVVADTALEGYWSAFFMAINTIQWVVLAWQRWRIDGLASIWLL